MVSAEKGAQIQALISCEGDTIHFWGGKPEWPHKTVSLGTMRSCSCCAGFPPFLYCMLTCLLQPWGHRGAPSHAASVPGPCFCGGVPYISEFTPVFLPVAFPHATSPPPAQARKVFIYLSVPMTPNFCLSLQLLSTTGFQSSSSATSTRSRTRTRYRTRAVSSQVDENLFGGIKVTLTEPPLGQLLRTNLALRKPPPKGLPDGRQREVPRTVLLNSDV